VAVATGVAVVVAVAVTVGVGLGGAVTVDVAVGVGDGVAVGVHVAVGVGVPVTHVDTLMLSTRQPWPGPLLSLAMRQRSLLPGAWLFRNGTATLVVINPSELPLQA